jgi:ferritin-like metal-binding protein YciE
MFRTSKQPGGNVVAINNLNDKFMHDLGDIYDAEHQFLKAQQEMLENATDPRLQQMITTHIQQSEQQVRNLEQVFSILGAQPQRVMCDGAKGIVSEGQKGLRETAGNNSLRDVAIAGAADRTEHYEVAAYRCLIAGARLMGQQNIVNLLQQNLDQEEQTAQLIESSTPQLLQTAMKGEGMQMNQSSSSQQYPTP